MGGLAKKEDAVESLSEMIGGSLEEKEGVTSKMMGSFLLGSWSSVLARNSKSPGLPSSHTSVPKDSSFSEQETKLVLALSVDSEVPVMSELFSVSIVKECLEQ